jgi:hypothetical protein
LAHRPRAEPSIAMGDPPRGLDPEQAPADDVQRETR